MLDACANDHKSALLSLDYVFLLQIPFPSRWLNLDTTDNLQLHPKRWVKTVGSFSVPGKTSGAPQNHEWRSSSVTYTDVAISPKHVSFVRKFEQWYVTAHLTERKSVFCWNSRVTETHVTQCTKSRASSAVGSCWVLLQLRSGKAFWNLRFSVAFKPSKMHTCSHEKLQHEVISNPRAHLSVLNGVAYQIWFCNFHVKHPYSSYAKENVDCHFHINWHVNTRHGN